MIAAADDFLGRFFDPSRLIGPIFDKELRVSRLRRNLF